MTPNVDVVIPSHGRLDGLADLIGRLRSELPHAEVIVVDSSPQPRASEVREATRCHGATYVVGPTQAGAKRNIGLSASQAEYVYFTDSDVLTADGVVSALVRALSARREPCSGATGPTFFTTNDSLVGMAVSRSAARRSAFEWPSRHDTAEWSTCTNLLVRRADAVDIGGFDETLPLPVYGEDVDFGLRLTRVGGPLVCVPHAAVNHPAPTTVGSQMLKSLRCGRIDAELQVRHPGRRSPVSLGVVLPLTILLLASVVFALFGWVQLCISTLMAAGLYAGLWLLARLFRHRPRPRTVVELSADVLVLLWDVAFEIGLLLQSLRLIRPTLATRRFGYRDESVSLIERQRKRDSLILAGAIAAGAAHFWVG